MTTPVLVGILILSAFATSAAAQPGRHERPSASGVYNVLDYGAKGDGVLDGNDKAVRQKLADEEAGGPVG